MSASDEVVAAEVIAYCNAQTLRTLKYARDAVKGLPPNYAAEVLTKSVELARKQGLTQEQIDAALGTK